VHPSTASCLAALVFAVACDRGSADVDTPPSASEPVVAASIAAVKALRKPFDCAAEIEMLSSYVDGLASEPCREDRDCAEVELSVCPKGRTYTNRDADMSAELALRGAIMHRCEVPACDPPRLGIPQCRGMCVAGRPAPPSRSARTCWHYEDRHLEARDSVRGTTAPLAGGVLRFSLVAVGRSWLHVAIDWPRDCRDCRLTHWVGEDMRRDTAVADPSRTEELDADGAAIRREHFEISIGHEDPVVLVPWSAAPTPFAMSVELLDGTGHPGAVSRHGTSWGTECEAAP